MTAAAAEDSGSDLEREIFGEEKVPESLAGYRIDRIAGRGRSAVVYEAFDPRENRPVALKVLAGDALDSAEERERFRREAEGAARLEHPNIVSGFEYGDDGGLPFFAMELVDGAPLDGLIEAGLVNPEQGLALMEKLARALDYAHSQGVVHRDLKPANVVIGGDGEPRIADFGLAKLGADSSGQVPVALTEIGVQVGTPCYMAPEQASGHSRDVDARTDVYAAGCMLYELAAGRRPFDGDNVAKIASMQIKETPVPPRRIRPGISVDLQTVILKCLEKKPDDRYASAGELADDLARCLAGRPVVARAGAGATGGRSRGAQAAALIAIVLAVAVCGLAWAREMWAVLASAGALLVLVGIWVAVGSLRKS